MVEMFDPMGGNSNLTVDSNRSVVQRDGRRNDEGRRYERLPARPRRRSRQSSYSEPRIQSLGKINWVRRLFVLSLVAALNSTNDGFAPFCDAFVTPTRKSTRAIRSEHLKIPETPKTQIMNGSATTSRRIHGNRDRSARSSSNGPASGNNIASNANNKQKKAEIAGFFLAVAIILSLAGISGTSDDEVASSSVAVVTKVVENTVPTTSTEVVAVTLGESIGGVIGAVSSVAINFVLRGGKVNDDSSKSSQSDSQKSKKSLLSQGLADSDYFIANSASNSLLEAAGVPETVAKYSSVFIAAIPSQLVKITPTLLKRNYLSLPIPDIIQDKASRDLGDTLVFWNNKKIDDSNKIAVEESGDSTVTSSSAAAAVSAIDFVEVFADVTRWLEYE